jgi:hypothetical protein
MPSTCGMGGRRRTRKTRRMRGGDGYSFGFDPETGTGGAGFTAVNTSQPYSSATGEPIADPFATKGGARRSRRSRKGKKTARKTKKAGRRHRKMKGGMTPSSVNAGSVGYGMSAGAPWASGLGLPTFSSYSPRGGPEGAAVNPDGVRSA